MERTFEIFKHPEKGLQAVKRGFSWPGFFFTWIWALVGRMWLVSGVLLFVSLALGWLHFFQPASLILILASLAIRVVVGIKGNGWKADTLQNNGFSYQGAIRARNPADAVAKVSQAGGSLPEKLVVTTRRSSLLRLPPVLQHLFAVASLTWKAAFRFRLFLVVAVLLLLSVVGLPLLLKDDGTARGFTQILLTYTLSTITALLGLSTLWLACGTLARDIEDCQIQVVAVKPISRWEIWLGKWFGLMSLNAALLALSGASVFFLLQWRATRLPADQQQALREEVLVARGSAREMENFDQRIREETERLLQERLAQSPITHADLAEVRRQIHEQVKANYQIVPPGFSRYWEVNLGSAEAAGKPVHVRIKFNAASQAVGGTFVGLWQVGVPQKTQLWRSEAMSLAPDTFHEFQVPALLDERGILTLTFVNPNNTALLFPLDEGLEVLYPEGSFALNFARGLGVIFCWMGLLTTLGLASASFLSFPVAAFCSLGVLSLALFTDPLKTAVTEGTLGGYDAEKGTSGRLPIDVVAIPVFRVLLKLINLAKDFSPIDALSTGRSIPWSQLGQAFGQIVLLLGGIMGIFGILVFTRRELATAQGTQ